MANCGGPDGFKWDGERCVSSTNQTSCDSVAQETCWYAALLFSPPEWMGGTFVEGESGPFRIECPGSLVDIGIKEGTVIDTLNGQPITPEAITAFTPANPAKCAAHFKKTGGKRDLHLSY